MALLFDGIDVVPRVSSALGAEEEAETNNQQYVENMCTDWTEDYSWDWTQEGVYESDATEQ